MYPSQSAIHRLRDTTMIIVIIVGRESDVEVKKGCMLYFV
jgi:hypothetical protein